MRFHPLIILLLVPACGSLEPLVSPPIMDNAECRAEVTRAPEVRRTARELNAENQTNVRRVETERNEALRRLYNDCLRARGLPAEGGVAAIQRTW